METRHEMRYVRFDQAITGAALTEREALKSLIEAAKAKPRPFDRILVEDTSRLARNVADALRLSEILRFNGVHLSAVSQGIDSRTREVIGHASQEMPSLSRDQGTKSRISG